MTKQVGQQTNSMLKIYASEYVLNDEMWAFDGVKPHWERLISHIQQLGEHELTQRRSDIERLLREHGVSYNIYDDPNGMNRPWKLDTIPLVVSGEDWARTEKGLKQRAELLNLVLKDLYGKRNLIKEGLLPQSLVYNHIGFLRPCDQTFRDRAYPLTFYAADTAKTADGKRWVLGDRTQAPSGIGYALENRATMTKVMPDIFVNQQVGKLSPFLDAIHAALVELSPQYKRGAMQESPRIVVLTPGQRNEAYFEHAYLASFLGYPLVQGEDLMVRDDTVWLKTLGGLEQIDVIWRRVDDAFCDPLSLRADSQLGIAGLLSAVRKGNVAIADVLGSGVLENPALMAFLPKICQVYLGEELLLPSVATWWCGHEKELRYVLENLENLVIKTIYPQGRTNAIFGSKQSKEALQNWRDKINAQPHLYLAQEQLDFISTPSFVNNQLEPRNAVLRCFLVGSEAANGYTVMHGGLTRSSSERNNIMVSNQNGGISKDTWVAALQVFTNHVPLSTTPLPFHQKHQLSSRTAENLYWVGRYAARAKMSTRLLKAVIHKLNEISLSTRKSDKKLLYDLLCSLTQLTMTYPGFIGDGSKERLQNPEKELIRLTLDYQKSGSLMAVVQYMMRSVYAIRPCWSADTWRILDQIDDYWKMLSQLPEVNLRDIQIGLDQLIMYLAAFAGFNRETLNQKYELPLLDLGRRIEKSLLSIALHRSTLTLVEDTEVEQGLMETVLSCQESLYAYRSKYQSKLYLSHVLELLLFDATHPSSLLCRLLIIQKTVKDLPRPAHQHRLSEEEKLILEAISVLQLADIQKLTVHKKGTFIRQELEYLLAKVSGLIANMSNIIVSKFFSHAQKQQLSENIEQKIDL
ncbi:MAG: hypothetical protein EAZ08_06635 [Cytophagales bacterium]|nr:MAG: hypothetical protein EAZ08_06635 [Cytophagales bacterium]